MAAGCHGNRTRLDDHIRSRNDYHVDNIPDLHCPLTVLRLIVVSAGAACHVDVILSYAMFVNRRHGPISTG